MTAALFLIAGLILGSAFALADESITWFVAGPLVGWLLGWSHHRIRQLQATIDTQDDKLRWLYDRLQQLEHGAKTSEVAPPTTSREPSGAPVETSTPPVRVETPAADPAPRPTRQASPATAPARQAPRPHRPAPAHKPTPLPAPGATVSRTPPDLLSQLRELLSGTHMVVRVGLVIVLVGVGLLVKLAADVGMMPVWLRLLGAAGLGGAGVGLGWKLRTTRPGFARSLQGGGLGVLFITTLAAMHLVHLIPLTVGFGLLVGLVLLAGALALAQDSFALAIFAALGAFAAPLVASDGSGSHVVLFAWYLGVNAGLLWMSRQRAWRALQLLGFVSTFVVGAAWGGLSYEPALFASVEPFLVSFALMFTAMGLFGARHQVVDGHKGWVDGTLLYGTATAFLALQGTMLHDTRWGMALSCLGASVVYLGLAAWLRRASQPRYTSLSWPLTWLAIATFVLAAPFALDDGLATGAAWAVEGALLIGLGRRQGQPFTAWAGVALQLISALVIVGAMPDVEPAARPFLQGRFAALAVAGSALWAGVVALRDGDVLRVPPWLARWPLALGGVGLWSLAMIAEATDAFDADGRMLAVTTGIALVAVGADAVGRRTRTAVLRQVAWTYLAVVALSFVMLAWDAPLHEPLTAGRWAVALGTVAWLIHSQGDGFLPRIGRGVVGSGVVAVAALESAQLTARLLTGGWPLGLDLFDSTWSLGVALLVGVTGLYLMRRFPAWRLPAWARVLLGAVLGMAWLDGHLTAGAPTDPTYLPLLHPLDLAGIGLLWLSLHRLPAPLWWSAAFVQLNVVLSRTVATFSEASYDLPSLAASDLWQTLLSVTWALVGITAMWMGHARARRPMWIGGATLLGVVVVKLFAVDLSALSAAWQVVAFLAVGLMMVGIGYAAPVPPRSASPDPARKAA